MEFPSNVKYTKEHEWIRVEGDIVYVGTTDKGYPIARRTVAKYRQQLNIPVARLKKVNKL